MTSRRQSTITAFGALWNDGNNRHRPEKIAHASIAPDAPASQDQFQDWLTALAMTSRRQSKITAFGALWNDGNNRHRPEKIAQVIARSTWLEHCRARDIDISREAECGRGSVDFKLSRGWSIRGLIEVKQISSNQFIHGADTQLPIYLKGEKAPFCIYMCIGCFDKDFDQGRLDLVNDACDAITTQGKSGSSQYSWTRDLGLRHRGHKRAPTVGWSAILAARSLSDR